MLPTGELKILIVDDESGIRSLLSAAFHHAGFTVRTACDAGEAMARCAEDRFDVILSDVRMPGMDGHELIQWIAAKYPQTKTVLMSGFDLECRECPLSQRCVLLNKPFRPAEAISVIQATLNSLPAA